MAKEAVEEGRRIVLTEESVKINGLPHVQNMFMLLFTSAYLIPLEVYMSSGSVLASMLSTCVLSFQTSIRQVSGYSTR